MKKVKFWLIFVVVLTMVGATGYTTYAFVVKNMKEIELKEQDLIPPTLVLTPLTIEYGKEYNVYSFVDSCKDDVSKKCQIQFLKEEMASYTEPGTYEIILLAKDEKENEVEVHTTLTITSETKEETQRESPSTETKAEEPSVTTNPVSKIGTTSIDRVEVRTIYGTTCEYKITTYYDLYSDGSKKETGSSEKENGCNYTLYHATLEELSPEAEVQMNTYAESIGKAYELLYQERLKKGLSEITLDPLLLAASQYRTLEIGYSNVYSLTRPNTDVSILDELQIQYTGGIEFIVTGSMDANAIIPSVLNDPTFQSYFTQNAFSKIGIGLSLVHDQYIWVFYLIA